MIDLLLHVVWKLLENSTATIEENPNWPVEYDGSEEPMKIAGGALGGGLRAWMELGEGRGGVQGMSGRSREKRDREGWVTVTVL
jgi:hypothetical protein